MDAPQSMATIRDIAQRAGVHHTTVSSVLNKGRSTVRVSEATRQRIMAAAEELRYSPNIVARGLRSVRFNVLGVLFQSLLPGLAMTAPYSSALLGGIVDHAHASGYNIMLFHKQWLDAERSAAGFRGQGIDGYLIVAPLNGSDVVPALTGLGIPVTVISSSFGEYGTPSVDVDNARGVRLALDHLLALGHRRIALMMHDLTQHDIVVRRDTFLTVLTEARISVPQDYLRTEGDGFVAECLHALMSLPVPPTAILTTNDGLAFKAIAAARASGIDIPRQLSVVGFDDYPEAKCTTPPLTTVRQPLFAMGQAAARLLISCIEGDVDSAHTHLFEPELVVRESTTVASK